MRATNLFAVLLLFPITAFAAITGHDRGTGGDNGSSASTTVTPTSNLAAGSTGILCVAADNANNTATNFPTSITDSVGNVWTLRVNSLGGGGANTIVEKAIYTSILTTGFTTSNNLVITYTAANVVAKAWTLTEAVPATAGNVCLFRAGLSQTNQSASTSPTITTATTVLIGEFVLGTGGAESADTWVDDADTLDGTWSTGQHTGFGTGATGMSITSQWKVETTGNTTQTYNPTLTAADCGVSVITLAEVPPNTRTCASSSTTEAATTMTFHRALATNSIGVLCWAGDNTGTNGASSNLPSTLTDSKSNTWTLRQTGIYDPGAAGAGSEIGIYTATISTPLVIGDTVAITYGIANVTAKTWTVFEFSDATAYSTGNVGTGATTATPSVTTSSITYPDYVIGLAGAEGDNTWVADSDSSNGSWSSGAFASPATSATTGYASVAQYKSVTNTATQTFNPTLTSADTMIGWIELTVPAPASTATKIPTIPSIGGDG